MAFYTEYSMPAVMTYSLQGQRFEEFKSYNQSYLILHAILSPQPRNSLLYD